MFDRLSDPAPQQAAAPSTPIEFSWRGRVLTKHEVARIFLAASAIMLVLGILLNYVLTGGRVFLEGWMPRFGSADWYTATDGEANQYLSWAIYDVVSGALLVISLILLGVGFLARPNWRHIARAVGFSIFGFYWGTQAMKLFYAEEGDFVNMVFAMFAVFFFNYFAYHEVVSYRRQEDPRALQWLAGTSFITTGVYFVTHKLEIVANWLILRVAEQTQWMLVNVFNQPTLRCGGHPDGSMIIYPRYGEAECAYAGTAMITDGWFPIQIILACTAIQSIMIFVGGIMALRPPRSGEGVSGKLDKFAKLADTYNKRRLWAMALTVPLIYVLNLFRNVLIIWMSGQREAVFFASNESAFWFSHNVIGKGGSLVALILIAFIVFQILPELYDSIIGLLDLKERRGPLESWLSERFGRRGGGTEKPPELSSGLPGAAAQPTPEVRSE